MVLRDSKHRGSASVESAIERVRRSRGEDRNGYRAEFMRMIENYAVLDVASPDEPWGYGTN